MLISAIFSELKLLLTQQGYQRSNNYYYNVNLRLTNSKVFILFIFNNGGTKQHVRINGCGNTAFTEDINERQENSVFV